MKIEIMNIGIEVGSGVAIVTIACEIEIGMTVFVIAIAAGIVNVNVTETAIVAGIVIVIVNEMIDDVNAMNTDRTETITVKGMAHGKAREGGVGLSHWNKNLIQPS